VHWAQAWKPLRQLAELLGAPVTTSLGGKSAFPEDIRFRSDPAASRAEDGTALPRPCDVIFGIGCSFTETNFAVAMPRESDHPRDPRSDHLNKDILPRSA